MLSFAKDVLRHSAIWNTTEEECATVLGFPDTKLLNVNEGFEVLFFITRYMGIKGWGSDITFKNIESVIKTRLPYGVQSHRQVKEWLDANFRK